MKKNNDLENEIIDIENKYNEVKLKIDCSLLKEGKCPIYPK